MYHVSEVAENSTCC